MLAQDLLQKALDNLSAYESAAAPSQASQSYWQTQLYTQLAIASALVGIARQITAPHESDGGRPVAMPRLERFA